MTDMKNRLDPWSEREDELLGVYRQNGLTRVEISEKLNRTQGAIDQRVGKLGLASAWKMHRRATANPVFDSRPLDLGDGDGCYVDRCMEHGGFASFVRHAGHIVFGYGGRVWTRP